MKTSFSASMHWENCLLLEKEMMQILEWAPIGPDEFDANLRLTGPKLVDILTKSCFLLEASFKGIYEMYDKRLESFLHSVNKSWARNLLQSKNCHGKGNELGMLDYLTFFNEYCALYSLEPRLKYSQHVSDAWVNNFRTFAPFRELKLDDGIVIQAPAWWNMYNKVKHEFYSYPSFLTLESSLESLAVLISFSAVVPQMRRLLCDHGFIRDNAQRPVSITTFGRRNGGAFERDELVRHIDLVIDGHENDEFMPPMACVTNLFVIQIVGDYRTMQSWSGLGFQTS